jgi:DNA-binding Lrp family transcriptional regulator
VSEENLAGDTPAAIVDQNEKVGVAGTSPVDDFKACRPGSPSNIDRDNSCHELGRWPSLRYHPAKFFKGPIDRLSAVGTLNARVRKERLAYKRIITRLCPVNVALESTADFLEARKAHSFLSHCSDHLPPACRSPETIGQNVRACPCQVDQNWRVEGHANNKAEAFQEAVIAMPETISCHLIAGDIDYLIEVVVPDLDHYQRYLVEKLLNLPIVREVRSYIAIQTLKAGAPLPLHHFDAGPGAAGELGAGR